MTEAFATAILTAVLTAVPTIIVSVTGLVVAVRQSNKKTVETAKETNQLVGAVHQEVNGKNTSLTNEIEAVRRENAQLREELSRLGSKRSMDTDVPNG